MSPSRPEREDLVALAAADAAADAEAGTDLLAGPGPTVLQRWGWWSAASLAARICCVVAALSLVAAAGLGGAAALHSPHRVQVTSTLPAAPLVPGADAIGCPIGRTCGTRPFGTALMTELAVLLPGSRVVVDVETYDRQSESVYRRYLVVRLSGRVFRLVGQCMPQATPVDPGSGINVANHDFAGAGFSPGTVVDERLSVGGACTMMAWGGEPSPDLTEWPANDPAGELVSDAVLRVGP